MKKVLLIEDNLEMRENTSEILELSGYEVTSAENGKRGIELAKELVPDIIICDVMMPEMDGFGVLHVLSKEEKTSNIPFIFLTAKADRSDMRKGMNLGADDYLTKPFEDVELLEAIEIRLKKKVSMFQNFQKFLKELPNSSSISDPKKLANLNEIIQLKNRKIFKKKQFIFYEGDESKGLYILHSGKAKLLKTNEDGREYILSVKKEGEFIGYEDLLSDSDASYSCVALEDCEMSVINKEEFDFLVHSSTAISDQFIKILSQNLKELEEKLMHIAYDTVRKRTADLLVSLHGTYQSGDKDKVSFSIPREDMSNMAGTATETLIRALSEFKYDGCISIKGSQITIDDFEALKKIRY